LRCGIQKNPKKSPPKKINHGIIDLAVHLYYIYSIDMSGFISKKNILELYI